MQSLLVRYTCQPNYPVIAKAFVIFQVSQDISGDKLLLELGRELATKAACSNVGLNEGLEILGYFDASKGFKGQVIHAETGEY